MKKSQIMAASALAIATTGVIVAPVAQVSAWTIASDQVAGAATTDDARAVITAITDNSDYTHLVDFINTATRIEKDTYGYNSASFDTRVTTDILGNYDHFAGGTPTVTLAAGVQAVSSSTMSAARTNYTSADNTGFKRTIESVQRIIDAAKLTRGYTIMSTIYDAVEADAGAKATVAMANDFNAAFGDNLLAEDDVLNTKLNGASIATTNNFYTVYAQLIKAVRDTEKEVNAYNDAYTKLNTAWENLGGLIVLDADNNTKNDAYDKLVANPAGATAATAKIPDLKKFAALVIDALTLNTTLPHTITGLNAANIKKAATWYATYGDVATLQADITNDALPGTIYTNIRTAAEHFGKANGKLAATAGATAITNYATELVGYKAQEKPNGGTEGGEGDDQNTPEVPGTTTNGDVTEAGEKPGNTGVIGAAEGTASTTVSIVAGLATALTALGAGVVAYRNIRRKAEDEQ